MKQRIAHLARAAFASMLGLAGLARAPEGTSHPPLPDSRRARRASRAATQRLYARKVLAARLANPRPGRTTHRRTLRAVVRRSVWGRP